MTQSRVFKVTPPSHPLQAVLLQGQDSLCNVPLGVPWYDVLSPSDLMREKQLALVIYPNESLLVRHARKLEKMGYGADQIAIIASTTPPHEIRAIWDQVDRQKLPLLMMTAQRFQHIATLSKLLRHPRLGPILLEHSHLALPFPLGPYGTHIYQQLPEMFQQQWKIRPPLMLFAAPLDQRHRERLIQQFQLPNPFFWSEEPDFRKIRMSVHRCLTEHQKMQHLLQFIQEGQEFGKPPGMTLILYNRPGIHLELECRLRHNGLEPLLYSPRLRTEEKELVRARIVTETHPVVLLDAQHVGELMLGHFPLSSLQVILWEIPAHRAEMMQQILPDLPRSVVHQDVLLLYTKEDFHRKKKWIKQRVPGQLLQSLEELERLRSFCIHSEVCRLIQLRNWLQGWEPYRPDCQQCDICLTPPSSSLWRNLVDAFLY